MPQTSPVMKPELSGLKHLSSGKVREMYDLGNELLIVTTDRISAFDVVLPNGIPQKGRVLNCISDFWFDLLKDVTPNHRITIDINEMPEEVRKHADILEGRTTLARKAKPFPVECVVRGYIVGSGWKDYQKTGSVCGIKLPEGLEQAQKLSEPIFTPATKATTGHDENISLEKMKDIIGTEAADTLVKRSLEVYSRGRDHAEEKGIILADTKFEFGEVDGEITLIDEVLTPDSSRYWPKSEYRTGISPPSFDKQFVRDYLETLDWDKTAPGPELPEEVTRKTGEKYVEAYRLITGRDLPL
jgi:phosphoribosylaminoimidazole-succinocarboxamide synthase